MAAKIKITVAIGIFLAGSILFLAITAFKGKIVKEASVDFSSPIVKVREMQTDPSSLTGLLGMGEVIYRAEYYSRNTARMTACSSLEGESQYAGKKVEVNWLTAIVCEVKVDDIVVFRWSGNEWHHTKP